MLNEFQIKKSMSVFWVMHSDRLRISGDIIFNAYNEDLKKLGETDPNNLKNIELAGIGTMLYAYSMENLLKALRIKLNIGATRSHNQIKLLHGTQLNYTLEETDLLVKLSSFAVWKGKYPVPLNEDELSVEYLSSAKNYNGFNIAGKSMIISLNPMEIKLFNEMYMRIREMIVA